MGRTKAQPLAGDRPIPRRAGLCGPYKGQKLRAGKAARAGKGEEKPQSESGGQILLKPETKDVRGEGGKRTHNRGNDVTTSHRMNRRERGRKGTEGKSYRLGSAREAKSKAEQTGIGRIHYGYGQTEVAGGGGRMVGQD